MSSPMKVVPILCVSGVGSGAALEDFAKQLQRPLGIGAQRRLHRRAVKRYLESTRLQELHVLPIPGILQRARSCIRTRAVVVERPYRLGGSQSELVQQIVYGADGFKRSDVGVVENRERETLTARERQSHRAFSTLERTRGVEHAEQGQIVRVFRGRALR